jgi:hypothetical protein
MRRPRILLHLVLFVSALVLSSMTPANVWAHSAASPAQLTPDVFLPTVRADLQTTYTAVYQPNTVIIDDANMAKLISSNADDTELHFESSASQVAALKPGQIVIFSGLALGQVAKVSTANNEIVVQTSAATLDQAIQAGTIGVGYHINWLNLPAATYAAMRAGPAGSELHLASFSGFGTDGLPLRDAATPPVISFTGKVQGWDVTLKLTPTGEQLNIDVTGKRVEGSVQVLVSGKGFISNFTQETFVTYEQSKLGEALVKSTGLSGEMEVKWATAAPSGGFTTIVSLQIPLELPIPLRVGPIPIELKLKTIVQIVPQLDVDQASSGGSWKATYRSDQGFEWHNTSVDVLGSLQSALMNSSGETVSAGFGPVGFGLGIEFPRVEVSVFKAVSAFITIKTYGTSIFLTEPPCQKGDLTLTAIAGFDFKFFGASLGTGQKTLWEQVIHKYKDDEPC